MTTPRRGPQWFNHPTVSGGVGERPAISDSRPIDCVHARQGTGLVPNRQQQGATHNQPHQARCVHRLGKDAATTPHMSAPSAAVAVQPYQYIAGKKLAIDGPIVSREWCVPRSTTRIVG